MPLEILTLDIMALEVLTPLPVLDLNTTYIFSNNLKLIITRPALTVDIGLNWTKLDELD